MWSRAAAKMLLFFKLDTRHDRYFTNCKSLHTISIRLKLYSYQNRRTPIFKSRQILDTVGILLCFPLTPKYYDVLSMSEGLTTATSVDKMHG